MGWEKGKPRKVVTDKAEEAVSNVEQDRTIQLVVPVDCTHSPEALRALLQEMLDTARPGEHVRVQVR
jgi:hypothetical protein